MAKANKSNPFSIRVDIEKFDFVKGREKVETGQQAVDFLLNKYWWENKLPHVTAKEAPPLELKLAFQDLTNPTNEIKPHEQPKTNYEVKIEPKIEVASLGSFEVFRQEILKTTMIQEIEAVMRKVKNSLLLGKERQALEAIAKEHSKQFYTD